MMKTKTALFEISVLLALFSCTSARKVVSDEIDHATAQTSQTAKDSVLIVKHDSVFVERWRDGDTVFVYRDRWRVEVREMERVRVDTVERVRKREVVKREEVVKYKTPAWCWWLLIIFLLWIILKKR